MINQEININQQMEENRAHIIREIIFPNPFFISAAKVKELTTRCDIDIDKLLRILVPIASSYAQVPISNYKVGIATLGKSGNIYLGVNLEFLGVPLNEAIHGEQFAITNARSHNETQLIAIALSAAPCGHCRQFLNEMEDAENLKILITDSPTVPLASLLPDSFGPKDLGLTGNLLSNSKSTVSPSEDSLLTIKAIEAAVNSYAPYTESESGIAIQLKDGTIYKGSYLENAAFNPSISPLQAALILLIADMRKYEEINEVVLVEKKSAKISQEIMSREILRTLAPMAVFHVKKMEF